MKTRFTDRLGLEVPIVLPGMSWISKPELVAAVSEAGALGLLATGPLTPEETRASIDEIRSRTDRPFGVGVTLMMPGATENARIAIEQRVPVVNFQLGRGEWLIEGVHAYGGVAMPTVTSVRHAKSAAAPILNMRKFTVLMRGAQRQNEAGNPTTIDDISSPAIGLRRSSAV